MSNQLGGTREQIGFRITERDIEILGWLGRVRLARVEQVQWRFGMARSKAYRRLQVLWEAGLVGHESNVPGPGVYLATRAGLQWAELSLASATVSLATLKHDLAMTDVVAELERDGKLLKVWTEREMRAEHARPDGRRFAPRVHEPGRTRSGNHLPDIVVDLADDCWVAIEVERTAKRAERTRAILQGYYNAAGVSNLGRVVYVVPTPRDQVRMNDLAAKVGFRAQRSASQTDLMFGIGAAAVRFSAVRGYRGMASWLIKQHCASVAADAERARQIELQQEAVQVAREHEAAVQAQRAAQREEILRRQRAERERAAAEAARPIKRFKRALSGG
ncbi:hypothetical protein OJ997_25255 [Solirubrobacter phytolaccae]|uniref:Replication-relaxation n=1 Tax=Solirubrobacter phytolaccae TaxID=1404360 RepID=A0A9X3NGI7_9ACTN|nr:hypothetical protein [Solirubrobacter phytolaccae]MDA0183641.1 hypothetical protein [Solirubrobacter phytolaccae]